MNKFLCFLAGCVAGAVTALLLTPKTGEEVRGMIDKGMEKGKNIAEMGRRRVNVKEF